MQTGIARLDSKDVALLGKWPKCACFAPNLVLAFVVALTLLFISNSPTYAACSVPNAITNGQTTDASQVMGNFNALVNCAPSVSGTPATGNLTKFADPQTVTNGDLSGDVTTAGSLATALAPTGVSPGTYTCANVSFDAKGRALSAMNGACGSGGTPTLIQNAAVRGTSPSQTSFTTTLASAPTPGNLLISVMSGYQSNMVCPSGFSGAYQSGTLIQNQGILVCARIVQTGDGATFTGTLSSANGGTIFGVFEFQGAIGFQASATGGTPSGSSWSMLGTPLNGSCFTLGVAESDSVNTYSSITGGTLLFDGTSGSGGVNHPSVLFQASGLSPVTITYTGTGFGNSIVAMVNIVG